MQRISLSWHSAVAVWRSTSTAHQQAPHLAIAVTPKRVLIGAREAEAFLHASCLPSMTVSDGLCCISLGLIKLAHA